MKSVFIVATVTGLLILSSKVHCKTNYEIYYQWKTIEYDIPSNIEFSDEYIPENNLISHIAIFEDRMWLSTPRYLPGVPVTLSTVPYKRKYRWWEELFFQRDESPKLQPFPNYEKNKLGDCDALQLAHALDIDQFGRLWVVDVGRVNILEEIDLQDPRPNLCPAKLVIFDVNNGRSDEIFTYTFPDDVAPPTTNFIRNIQVACETEEDCWAFVPDIALSRLIVYDHKNRQSWTVQHPSMAPDPNKLYFSLNGVPAAVGEFGINAIGLAPRKFDFSDLYFSPLAGSTMYRMSTDILKNPQLKQNGTLQQNDVITFGEESGQSNGFAVTSKGRLFYGSIPDSSVVSIDADPELIKIEKEKTVAQSNVDLLWPSAFAFDGKGKLVVTTNKFHRLRMYNPAEYNYRVALLRHIGDVYSYNSC